MKILKISELHELFEDEKIKRRMNYKKYSKKINERKKQIVTCECGAVLKRGNLWNHINLTSVHKSKMMRKKKI